MAAFMAAAISGSERGRVRIQVMAEELISPILHLLSGNSRYSVRCGLGLERAGYFGRIDFSFQQYSAAAFLISSSPRG